MGVLHASCVKTDLKLNPTQIQKILLESCDSVALLAELLLRDRLVKLGRQLLAGRLAKGLLDKVAGLPTGRAGKAFCRDGGLTLGVNDDLDGFH